MALEKAYPAWLKGVLFFMLLEMGTGFMNVRSIGRSALRVLHGSG